VFLVTPDDANALAAGIDQLAADRQMREKLGAGAKVLAEMFRWDKIATDTLELYHAIGAGQAGPPGP
jgi:glycosyltransferase involved in cell wall biosynthesis